MRTGEEDETLKLFVIGESSGDPERWSEWGPRTLVLARDEQEALAFAEHSSVAAAVIYAKPGVLLTTEGMQFNDL